MLLTERDIRIGRKVRDLRWERAVTQAELAKLAGIHEITISDIENGKRSPSARTLRKLAGAFDVEVRELTGSGQDAPRFPGGARAEEHFDAILEHEDEKRERRETDESRGEGDESGGSKT